MLSRRLRVPAGIIVLLWLSGCASTPQSRALFEQFDKPSSSPVIALASSVLLDRVPFFPQEAYQCGPAALATVLQASRVSVTPDALVGQVYVPARQGSLQIEMLAAARAHGRIAHVLPADLPGVLKQLQAGEPVLVMQNLGLSWYPQWHYAVLVGYDLARREVVLRSGLVREYRMPMTVFERTWQRAGHWAVVLLPPGQLPEDERENAYVQSLADFSRQADAAQMFAAYEVGLQRWPESRVLGMALANLHYAEGNRQAARMQYERVLRHAPDFAAAHNNLAQTLLELGELALAHEHALTAVRLGGSFAASYERTLDAVNAALMP
ncbi:MAG: PA2778 family cysteine peptidase [Pseudomonadales bacterium]|nr:PA2778 family cysteine peptidase [Pseudomonadales bacterium]MCP5330380.1 PA2778 family cysteine peptidase [Pseudomonadales bacterium]MCP5344007.1 PA2778 family cysteine peptidase [Pseudomonadales bacterium]